MGRPETSVAEALGRAHAALLSDLRGLEQAVSPSSGGGLDGLRAGFGAAHAHITEHFRFEEDNGYMAAVRTREPRLVRPIQQLADEHRQLARFLDSLLRQAGSATELSEALRQEVRAWIEGVRQHEARENDLIQNAFNLDIGAED